MQWDFLGNEWVTKLLLTHLTEDKLKHAYLFIGPAGIGKRKLANLFTSAILCESTIENKPCLDCATCLKTSKNNHPDIVTVQADNEQGKIKKNQIDTLVHSLNLSAFNAKYKVGVIHNIEQATHSAANSLLKTLEEPPTNVILVLTSTSQTAVLETIVSRCEVIKLRSVPTKSITEYLIESFGIEPGKADAIAHIAIGKPELAITLLENDRSLLNLHNETIDKHIKLLNMNLVDRFSYAASKFQNREKAIPVLTIWLSFWRDLLMSKYGMNNAITYQDHTENIEYLVSKADAAMLKSGFDAIQSSLSALQSNANPRLIVESLLLKLPVMD